MTTDTEAAERKPISDEAHEEGVFYSITVSVGVDLNDDGEDDVWIAPAAGIDCPDDEDRGPLTAATCPFVEDLEPTEVRAP